MDNKLKTLIVAGIIVVVAGTGDLMLNEKKIIMIDKQVLDLDQVFIEGYCVDGEQILFNTTPESIDEMHCFTKWGYERLQREVLARNRAGDTSNQGLLYAMIRKELAEHKDDLLQSVLIKGLIEDGSFNSLVVEYTNTKINF